MSYRDCAFCHESEDERYLVHYSTRRYAHGPCLLKAKGREAVDALLLTQLYKLGVIDMLCHGYDVIGAVKTRKAQERAG